MSTAKELFKELGYEKAEKSESVVLYTNGYGDTISFKETKLVVMTPIQGCRSLMMTCLLENAIHKQCKELGWLEEEKQKPQKETNLEHYYEDLLKVNGRFAFMNGKIKHCYIVSCCDECAFSGGNCKEEKIKWLANPYEKPTYKLNQFEYDLLRTNNTDHDRKLSSFATYKSLKEIGYFKDIDFDLTINEILNSCKVVKDEKC